MIPSNVKFVCRLDINKTREVHKRTAYKWRLYVKIIDGCKGVVSLILPDEEMPQLTHFNGKPIDTSKTNVNFQVDLIANPLGKSYNAQYKLF